MLKLKKHGLALLVAITVSLFVSEVAVAGKKGDVKVICHYMTWFRYRMDGNNKLDISHWKWSGKNAEHDPRKTFNNKTRDVYSRFYPRIGIYDSGDPLVADYHILTAKAAGISTLIIDWYQPGSTGDAAFQTLLERCEALNMQAAICYEEKTCFPDWNKISTREQAVAKAVNDFTYLNKYFKRKGYWKKNGKPVILVFGGWGDWPQGRKLFNAGEWSQITAGSQTDGWLVLQNYKEKYPNIKAGFAWQGDRAYTKWFYATGDHLVKKGQLDFYIGSACPGFDDRGTWGWNSTPRFEAYLGLENFDRYLNDFDNSECGIIQVVTWNDFAEGTMIEPTVQFGNLYLNRLGEWSSGRNNKQFAKINTLLPYKWFYLAKSLGADLPEIARIKAMLADEKYAEADGLIEKTAQDRKIVIPPYISCDKEFKPYFAVSGNNVVQPEKAGKKILSTIKWRSDGFLKQATADLFVLNQRNYGAIEEISRHGLDEQLQVDIIKLSAGAAYTIQLLMFDKKNNFLGSIDIKKSNVTGVVDIDTAQMNKELKPGVFKVGLKIWLEGKPGSEIKLAVKK